MAFQGMASFTGTWFYEGLNWMRRSTSSQTQVQVQSIYVLLVFSSKPQVIRIELCKKRVYLFISHLQRPSTNQSSCKDSILMRFTPNFESKISQQIGLFSLEINNQASISHPYQEKDLNNKPHYYESICVTQLYFSTSLCEMTELFFP